MTKNYMEKDFEERLFNYNNLARGIENIKEEIELLETQLYSSGVNKKAYNSGGSDFNSVEKKYSSMMSRIMILRCELKTNIFYYTKITDAFSNCLDNLEKTIVKEYFFNHVPVEKIEVNYETAQKYRIINKTVSKMIYYIYGSLK